MDIWEKMYEEAQKLYNPHEVSDFVYANHVVAAVEAEDGQIFTGFCMEGTCGVFHLCAERAALFNMYQFSGQTKVKKVLAFREQPPYGGSSGMPCGACREFLLELNAENKDAEVYDLHYIQSVDMFPHTARTEAVVKLIKKV